MRGIAIAYSPLLPNLAVLLQILNALTPYIQNIIKKNRERYNKHMKSLGRNAQLPQDSARGKILGKSGVEKRDE